MINFEKNLIVLIISALRIIDTLGIKRTNFRT